MVLFWAAIRIDSVSLLNCPFRSHVQILLFETSLVYRLKYPYSCFSTHFCFLVFVLLIIMLSVLFLISITSLSLLFFMYSSSPYIDALTLSLMLANPLPPSFLDTYNQSISSLGCEALCIVIGFLVIWIICLSSSLVYFKNGPVYLSRVTAQVFIPLMIFLLKFSRSSEILFFIFSFISTCLMVSASNIPEYS